MHVHGIAPSADDFFRCCYLLSHSTACSSSMICISHTLMPRSSAYLFVSAQMEACNFLENMTDTSLDMNFVYALFIPLGVLVAYNVVTKASPHKHEVTYLSFAIAIIMGSFLTDLIKNTVGRPRPDLLARCKPATGTKPDVLVTIDVCTETAHHLLHDGWRSFPSGHSSFSFSGLGFLSLFLAGQLHIFRHNSGGRDLSRALICLLPLLGAALIAISRCEDYRHDVYDVSVGSLLGYVVAYWSYRRHWPKLTAKECHEPHPYPGSDPKTGWNRLRDEEEAGDSRPDVGYEMTQLNSQRH